MLMQERAPGFKEAFGASQVGGSSTPLFVAPGGKGSADQESKSGQVTRCEPIRFSPQFDRIFPEQL